MRVEPAVQTMLLLTSSPPGKKTGLCCMLTVDGLIFILGDMIKGIYDIYML